MLGYGIARMRAISMPMEARTEVGAGVRLHVHYDASLPGWVYLALLSIRVACSALVREAR